MSTVSPIRQPEPPKKNHETALVPDFRIGAVVSGTRYRVVRLIGQGGMGRVYEVEHVELGKRFVLKALLRDLTRRPDLVARLRTEWRALGRLNHPNIVDVTDAGSTDDDIPFFVMERLAGETLGQRLKRDRRLPVNEALTISLGVLEGLSAAHDIGVVHRDVKPPNVFLKNDGNVKLLDFGVAKMMGHQTSSITMRGVAIGTPRYMSPEQARGEAVDGRADLYATGLMLFEMLTGGCPFDDARDANELLIAQIMRPAPLLSESMSGIPRELDLFVAMLLAKDPKARPNDAHEAVELLRSVAVRANEESAARGDPKPDDAPFGLHRARIPAVGGPSSMAARGSSAGPSSDRPPPMFAEDSVTRVRPAPVGVAGSSAIPGSGGEERVQSPSVEPSAPPPSSNPSGRPASGNHRGSPHPPAVFPEFARVDTGEMLTSPPRPAQQSASAIRGRQSDRAQPRKPRPAMVASERARSASSPIGTRASESRVPALRQELGLRPQLAAIRGASRARGAEVDDGGPTVLLSAAEIPPIPGSSSAETRTAMPRFGSAPSVSPSRERAPGTNSSTPRRIGFQGIALVVAGLCVLAGGVVGGVGLVLSRAAVNNPLARSSVADRLAGGAPVPGPSTPVSASADLAARPPPQVVPVPASGFPVVDATSSTSIGKPIKGGGRVQKSDLGVSRPSGSLPATPSSARSPSSTSWGGVGSPTWPTSSSPNSLPGSSGGQSKGAAVPANPSSTSRVRLGLPGAGL